VADADAANGAADRSAARWLGLLLFVTYAYFGGPPSWNENSRLDLTRSIVERGRLDIDPYHENTGDKARYEGRYYSDKAPGASVLAVPIYAGYVSRLRQTGRDLPATMVVPAAEAGAQAEDGDVLVNPSFRRALYLCNLSTNVIAGAALGAVYLLFLLQLGIGPRLAAGSAAALSLGTLVFPYSTMFYGHVLAAAGTFGAFALLWRAARAPASVRLSLLGAGALLGGATACELTAALAAGAVGVYGLVRVRSRTAILWLALGAAVPLVALLAYHAAAFGHPLRTGYAFVSRPEFAEGMSRGLMGIGWPRPGVLAAVLFGRSRGLLYVSPILLLAFVGLARGWLSRRHRPELLLASAVTSAYLLVSAGYYLWWGGAALGPRHFIVAIPFLALGLPFAVTEARRPFAVGVVFVVSLVVSIVNQTAATATAPAAPLVPDVLRDHVYRLLLVGAVPGASGAMNLGRLFGLRGLGSLVPLLVLWVLGAVALRSALPRTDGRAPSEGPDER
jgi:hypothetical protein